MFKRAAYWKMGAGAALALIAAGAAGSTLVYGNVSGWTVHTVPSDAYRCYAEAEYEGGTRIRIGFDSSTSPLYVVASDPSWRDVVAGREYVIDVQFDDEPARQFTATATGDAGLQFRIDRPQQERFLDDFMSRYALSIGRAENEPILLGLGGSKNATRMLETCQTTMAKS